MSKPSGTDPRVKEEQVLLGLEGKKPWCDGTSTHSSPWTRSGVSGKRPVLVIQGVTSKRQADSKGLSFGAVSDSGASSSVVPRQREFCCCSLSLLDRSSEKNGRLFQELFCISATWSPVSAHAFSVFGTPTCMREEMCEGVDLGIVQRIDSPAVQPLVDQTTFSHRCLSIPCVVVLSHHGGDSALGSTASAFLSHHAWWVMLC